MQKKPNDNDSCAITVASQYIPEEDGKTHINVYSKGRTPLGMLLSNFSNIQFTLPGEGTFASVEAYWYWRGTTHPERDRLRSLHGYLAKKVGRELRGQDWNDDPQFQVAIKRAIRAKMDACPILLQTLQNSTLPLAHYYVLKNGQVVEPREGKWVIEYLEELRAKSGQTDFDKVATDLSPSGETLS